MEFADVSKINLERAMIWHRGGLNEWSVTDWSNATAGEMGELCNAIKKLRRLEDGINQAKGPHTQQEALRDIATEIGDVYLYLDLLAQRLNINIETAIKDTFNRVSVREGFPPATPIINVRNQGESINDDLEIPAVIREPADGQYASRR